MWNAYVLYGTHSYCTSRYLYVPGQGSGNASGPATTAHCVRLLHLKTHTQRGERSLAVCYNLHFSPLVLHCLSLKHALFLWFLDNKTEPHVQWPKCHRLKNAFMPVNNYPETCTVSINLQNTVVSTSDALKSLASRFTGTTIFSTYSFNMIYWQVTDFLTGVSLIFWIMHCNYLFFFFVIH